MQASSSPLLSLYSFLFTVTDYISREGEVIVFSNPVEDKTAQVRKAR